MKKTPTMLLIIACLALVAQAAEPALEDIHKELTLTKARLELAEARLALAAKETELERVVRPARAGEDIRLIESAQSDLALRKPADISTKTLGLVRDFELAERAKPQAGAALQQIGRAKWKSLSTVQRQFLADRTGHQPGAPLGVRQDNLVGVDEATSSFIEIGLAQKKAAGSATATDAAVAEDAGIEQNKDQTGDTVEKTLYSGIKDDTFFRNAGISFSLGYGVVLQKGNDRGVGSLLARWNIRQAEATYWYNNLTAQGSGEGYKPVPFYGMDRVQFVDWYAKARGHPVTNKQSWLTAWGPFIGSTVAGEKLDSGSGEERPYLAGLSFGFGFSTEAASLFYVDVGTTISPKQGFNSNKLYVGFSADAALLPALWGKFRIGK